MSLDGGDQLSLLALIVAVVALIVSGWQLAQQLFATATDGKRFCQASVMGIWARKTRLSWRWSQIRFETKYTTPEIRLESAVPAELLRNKPPFRDQSKLAGRRRLMYQIPVLKELTTILNGPASDYEGYFDITSTGVDVPWELRQVRFPGNRIDPRSMIEKFSMWYLQLWNISYEEDSPDLVTWPNLLRSLFGNQIQTIAKVHNAPSEPVSNQGRAERLEKGDTGKVPYEVLEEGHRENRVVIKLVERSWDLVPPDVVRPLAKSTIGTIIVIANRFGMQWQDFSPNEGRMNAAGYGHEISSETIRGLGVVLQYTFREESTRVKDPSALRGLMADGEYFSPTEAADKLHCGIIPLDRDAVNKEYDVVFRDIQLVNSARQIDLEGLYSTLGIQRQVSNQIDESINRIGAGGPGRHFRHAIEDAISLLCPMIPLPRSEARCIMWPLRNKAQPFTPTRQLPGVEELMNRLKTSLESNKRLSNTMENRNGTLLEPLEKHPLEYMEEMCKGFAATWTKPPPLLGRFSTAIVSGEPWSSATLSLNLLKIHNETSQVFKQMQKRMGALDSGGHPSSQERPLLFDFIGAHVTTAVKYGAMADKTAKESAGADEDDSFVASRMRFVTELARLYVEDIESGPSRAVAKHLRRQGYTMDRIKGLEITALWWVLMLRGICWWMSVRLKLPESQIPSYWYYSQTPVYIS